jgi:hypothetical protein
MLRSRSSHHRSRILTASEVIQRQERVMDHGDPSPWRRLPGPRDAVPEEQAGSERARARHRGLRHVRRLSNWTAAGLVAATAVAAGYFAHASTSTSPQQAASVSGAQSKAPASSSNQACPTAVTAPVAVSGGSGVTATVPSQTTPVPGQACAPRMGSGAPPAAVYGEPHENEKGDS